MLTGLWASTRLGKWRISVLSRSYPVQEDGPILVINIDTRVFLNAHGKHLPEAKALRYMIQTESINRFCANQTSFQPSQSVFHGNLLLQNLEKHLRNGRAIIAPTAGLLSPSGNSRAASA